MARSSRAMAFTFGRTSTTSFIGDIFWSGHWGVDEQDEILQVPYCAPYNFLKNLAVNGKYFQEFPLQFDGNYYLKIKIKKVSVTTVEYIVRDQLTETKTCKNVYF